MIIPKTSKRRMMRQIIDFMWKKFKRGTVTYELLFKLKDAIDMPTPGEWRA